MTRFFAAPHDISGGTIRLTAEDAAHIRSLRLRPEDEFIVCDEEGSDYICRLGKRGDSSTAEILETRPSRGEASVICDAYIALAKGDRLDYAVQKSVELGARNVILFPSERCVAIPGDMVKKTARLQRIALETAKQCGRGRVPEVTAASGFAAAVGQAACAELPLFFYECEEEAHLKQILDESPLPQTISILTGPEGGFELFEAELAKSAGMRAVTLGPRILRCETAPAAALAAIMYHTGNL